MAGSCPYPLAKAKGLTNAEVQVKHSYRLKGISYIQMMWTVARRGILSLPDQEKTLWNLNMYRGYWSDLYQLKAAVVTPQKKATAWEQWSVLESAVGRGGRSSSACRAAGMVRAGAQGQARRWTVLDIASEHLNLPCSECKVSPCKPSPFHAPAHWAAYMSLIWSLEWHRATLAQDQALTSPPMWTFNVLCLHCQRDGHGGFYRGQFSYRDDVLSAILRKCP